MVVWHGTRWAGENACGEMEAGLAQTVKRGGPQAEACATGSGEQGTDERRSLAAHRARCSICKHPEREEIEREFVDWVSPREIAENWKIASYRAIYRHAHAVGLFERRRENRLAALDAIIERVREVPVTASAVVAAIRLSLELEGEPSGRRGLSRGQKFLLSLDGLPRTNAATGDAPDDEGTLQCAPTGGGEEKGAEREGETRAGEVRGGEGPGLRSVPTAGMADLGLKVSEPMRATHASPPLMEDGHRLVPALLGRQGVVAEGARIVAGEVDPRIVLGEDGRVAGIPWPKQKITFARFARRWRGRGG